jgi:hypothetical protein
LHREYTTGENLRFLQFCSAGLGARLEKNPTWKVGRRASSFSIGQVLAVRAENRGLANGQRELAG